MRTNVFYPLLFCITFLSAFSAAAQDSLQWVLEPSYQTIEWKNNSFFKIRKDWLWGLADSSGQILAAPVYATLDRFSENLAKVSLDGKYGFIDKSGAVVIPIQYDDAQAFREHKAAVRTNGKYGFIGLDGKMLVPPTFYRVGDFKEGLAMVRNDDNRWGYIDSLGTVVIPFQYRSAADFNEGLAKVKGDSTEFYINYETTYFRGMTPEKKQRARALAQKRAEMKDALGSGFGRGSQGNGATYVSDLTCKPVKSGNKWGLMEKDTGNWLLAPQFDDIDACTKSLFKVKTQGFWGVIRI